MFMSVFPVGRRSCARIEILFSGNRHRDFVPAAFGVPDPFPVAFETDFEAREARTPASFVA